MPSPLVLASRSPQRRAILERLGIPFEVIVPEVPELTAGDPVHVARENALRKATAVAERCAPGTVVLGADTVVALDGAIFGKPPDEAAARDTLRALGGRTHTVVGGVAIIAADGPRTAVAQTAVRFRELGDGLLAWYLARGEWHGRAGAYAIQGAGAALVEDIAGDYENVVGLPLATVLELHPGLLGIAL
ncbi:MAG: Maf family protein [Solirubrobacteraceae bacterium]